MIWLATPEELRDPPEIEDFRIRYHVGERTLARYHALSGFVEAVIRCMQPWLARVNEVRMCIYRNATDPTRKDQLAWIKAYESMIVTAAGERARFLTPAPKEEKRVRTRNEADGGPEAGDDDAPGTIRIVE